VSEKISFYNSAKLHMLDCYNRGLVEINESNKRDSEKSLLMDIHDTKTISELIMLASAQYAYLKATDQLADYQEFCSEIQVEQNLIGGKSNG
jgi:hypothetical protein